MSRPATLWFWRDWESDVALKACSLAAQGLWKRMLCIAAQHDPIGYVAINRVGLGPERIAKIVGAGDDEVRSLIDELSLNGVFTRDRNGTIYNRRMVRDAKKSAIARKNGKLGGNPNLTCRTPTPHPKSEKGDLFGNEVSDGKISEISASVKGEVKGKDKAPLKLKPIPLPVLDSCLPYLPCLIPKEDSRERKKIQKKERPLTALEILSQTLTGKTAQDVIDHRKALKKPLTPRAAEGLLTAFNAFGDPERAAEAMITNGWQGFKPEWLDNQAANGNGHAKPAGRSNGLAGYARLVYEDIERDRMDAENGQRNHKSTD